jgi:hypothetical protein
MKLIDLLVQELPKRGGWPDGVGRISMHADGCIFLDGKVAAKKFKLPRCSDGWSGKLPFEYTNEVTRDQYEAALAIAQQPVWNGEGLPPVGCECEFFNCDEWFEVTMLYGGSNLIVLFDHERQIERAFSIPHMGGKFRPMRSEADKKRDETIARLLDLVDGAGPSAKQFATNLYNAIARGDIPGVKLSE